MTGQVLSSLAIWMTRPAAWSNNLLRIYKEGGAVTAHFAFQSLKKWDTVLTLIFLLQVVEISGCGYREPSWAMTSRQTNIQCLSVSRMLQDLITVISQFALAKEQDIPLAGYLSILWVGPSAAMSAGTQKSNICPSWSGYESEPFL